MRNPELWAKIKAHRFDATTGTKPFSAKLAEQQSWGTKDTEKAIREYRRFLYLTQIAEGQVTPSNVIDRVWHTHLTFTRNYWDEFCGKVLGKPLHHDPCEGDEEMPRYRAQYEATLKLYRDEFGNDPPRLLWPHPASKRYIVAGAVISIVGVAMAAISLYANGIEGGWIWTGGGAAIALFGVLLCARYQSRLSSGGSGCGVSGCGGCGGGCG
ncbi:MAG: hypothetical protein AAFR35_13065 [Pseudomonadota bacterium]